LVGLLLLNRNKVLAQVAKRKGKSYGEEKGSRYSVRFEGVGGRGRAGQGAHGGGGVYQSKRLCSQDVFERVFLACGCVLCAGGDFVAPQVWE